MQCLACVGGQERVTHRSLLHLANRCGVYTVGLSLPLHLPRLRREARELLGGDRHELLRVEQAEDALR